MVIVTRKNGEEAASCHRDQFSTFPFHEFLLTYRYSRCESDGGRIKLSISSRQSRAHTFYDYDKRWILRLAKRYTVPTWRREGYMVMTGRQALVSGTTKIIIMNNRPGFIPFTVINGPRFRVKRSSSK